MDKNFDVVQGKEDTFVNFINKVSKKSKKIMGEPIQYEHVETHYRRVSDRHYIRVYTYRVYGPEPQINGWEFVARIDHDTPHRSIVFSVPGYEIPSYYWDNPQHCDHCNHNRNRNSTYILQNVNDGMTIQVGSTCLKEFVGYNIESYAKFFDEIRSLENDSFNGNENISTANNLTDINYLGAITMSVIRRDGNFVSRQKAYECGLVSTAFTVHENLNDDNYTDYDMELATNAINWFNNMSHDEIQNSSYLSNVKSVIENGLVSDTHIGIAVSLFGVYYNKFIRTNTLYYESRYVGNVKEKIERYMTVVDIIHLSSCDIVKAVDDDNNVFTWFRRGSVEVSQKYYIRGKVKGFREYNNERQTNLNYVKILS